MHIILNAQKEILFPKTAKLAGLFIESFEDPVLVVQIESLFGKGSPLEQSEV